MPRTATRSPARALVRRSPLNVVTPAQPIGAASTNDNWSGMRAGAVAGTTTDSA